MPPSGFDSIAVKYAVFFTKTCCKDLLTEVKQGKHENFIEGLEFEIRNLICALSGEPIPNSTKGMLILMQGYYEEILEKLERLGMPVTKKKLNEILRLQSEEFGKMLSQIHISKKGKLVRRRRNPL